MIRTLESRIVALKSANEEAQARSDFFEENTDRLKAAVQMQEQENHKNSSFKGQFLNFMEELEHCKKEAKSQSETNQTQK